MPMHHNTMHFEILTERFDIIIMMPKDSSLSECLSSRLAW